MKPMNINGIKIEFNERPKHKSVVAARGIMTQELMKMVDMSEVDPSAGVAEYIQSQIAEKPEIVERLGELQADVSIDQTIILATNLQYTTLQDMKEDMYADEFIELYEKSKKALGGKDAEDFFNIYPTSMSFRNLPETEL